MTSNKDSCCNHDLSVIDLTESFDLAIPHHLINTVIELDTTDESFDIVNNSDIISDEIITKRPIQRKPSKLNSNRTKKKIIDITSPKSSKSNNKRTSNGLGECPICCDILGKNPLASTKCGHVYCLRCLEESLKIAKKCPTCRCVLKGTSAYHPLYLNI